MAEERRIYCGLCADYAGLGAVYDELKDIRVASNGDITATCVGCRNTGTHFA